MSIPLLHLLIVAILPHSRFAHPPVDRRCRYRRRRRRLHRLVTKETKRALISLRIIPVWISMIDEHRERLLWCGRKFCSIMIMITIIMSEQAKLVHSVALTLASVFQMHATLAYIDFTCLADQPNALQLACFPSFSLHSSFPSANTLVCPSILPAFPHPSKPATTCLCGVESEELVALKGYRQMSIACLDQQTG